MTDLPICFDGLVVRARLAGQRVAPIVRQRPAHQGFVLSRVRSNENIVWLSSDSDDLNKTVP